MRLTPQCSDGLLGWQHHMHKVWILAAIAMLSVACTDEKSPLAPTAIAAPTPPVPTPPLPTTVPGVLALSMPIDPVDAANTAFGITPFGYHGADHALDGHPGWDIEYRPGASVRAAAAGTIRNVFDDPLTPGRFTIHIEHLIGEHFYRTVYTNIATLASSAIAADEVVTAGRALGIAGTISATVGTQPLTYAMTHFQLDDFEFHREGFAEPKAVSPEIFLTPVAKSTFDTLWSHAVFTHELVEPFATNPRDLPFPASRTWMRAGGDGPAGIRFTRFDARVAEYNYQLLAESGTVIESGAVAINVTARPYPLIALTSATAVRLGLYDIVSNEMRLALGPPGLPRPSDLSGAAVYRTVH